MTKIVAIHTVVYGKGQTALPNTPFDTDEATAAELIEAGAAREPNELELQAWGATPAAKKGGRKAKAADAAADADAGEGEGEGEKTEAAPGEGEGSGDDLL